MLSGRSIAAFALKFLVIYAALSASWPLSGRSYAFFLRKSGEMLLEAGGARDIVRIGAAIAPEGINDTVVFMRVAPPVYMVRIGISSWLIGFQPTCVLFALTLATPVSMRRRLWALFAGLLLVHAFVLARLTMFVIFGPVHVLPDTFWTQALQWSVFDFVQAPAVSCFAPVLIWIVVTLRREDLALIGRDHRIRRGAPRSNVPAGLPGASSAPGR